MTKAKRFTAFLLVAIMLVGAIPNVTFANNATVDRREELLGVWEGTYRNNHGLNGLRLTVFREGADIRAIFHFFPVEGSPAVQREGRYYASVDFNPSTEIFTITGTTWIYRPSRWTFANLIGTINGDTFQGHLTRGRNYTFSLTRIKRLSNSEYLEDLLGTWEGYAYNSRGIRGLRMTVFREGDNILAHKDFFLIQGSPENQFTSTFYASVNFDEIAGRFVIQGTTMIDTTWSYDWHFGRRFGRIYGDIFHGYMLNTTRFDGNPGPDYGSLLPFSLTRIAYYEPNECPYTIRVYLNGERVPFAQPPIIEDGRVFVPIAGIAGAMGGTVSWNDDNATATIHLGEFDIELPINGHPRVITRGGVGLMGDELLYSATSLSLDASMQFFDDMAYVPLNLFTEAYNRGNSRARLDWNEADNSEHLTVTFDGEIVIPAEGGVLFSRNFYTLYIPSDRVLEIYRDVSLRGEFEPLIRWGITTYTTSTVLNKLQYSGWWGVAFGLLLAIGESSDNRRMNDFDEAISLSNENGFVVIMVTTQAFGAPDWSVGHTNYNKLIPTSGMVFKSLYSISDDEWLGILSRII